ncbi:MAG: hypothetical protein QM811_17860 [Pirellulales bacterium]
MLGGEHHDTELSRDNLVVAYDQSGRTADADALRKPAEAAKPTGAAASPPRPFVGRGMSNLSTDGFGFPKSPGSSVQPFPQPPNAFPKDLSKSKAPPPTPSPPPAKAPPAKKG